MLRALLSLSVRVSWNQTPGISGYVLQSLIHVGFVDFVQDLGIKYLRMFTPYLDKGDLELILSIQDTEERIPLQDLLHAVNTRLHDLGGQAVIAVRTFALNGESDWRIHLLEVVQTLVAPDEVKWMEDEGTLADSQYISRALDDVEGRFKR